MAERVLESRGMEGRSGVGSVPSVALGSVPSVSCQFGLLGPTRLKTGQKRHKFGRIFTIHLSNGYFYQICFLVETDFEATKRFSAGNSRRFSGQLAPCRVGKPVTLLRSWRQIVLLVATNSTTCRNNYPYLSQQIVLLEATTTPICRDN